MRWLRTEYPSVVATATVGGAHLSSGPRGAAKLRAAGYLNGIPDVMILHPSAGKHGLFIEMKRPGCQLRPEQSDVHGRLTEAGYHCEVARSLPEFQDCVATYLGSPAMDDAPDAAPETASPASPGSP